MFPKIISWPFYVNLTKKKTKLAGQFKRPKGMGPTGEVASHCIEREARKRVNKENKE
jgi:hypothetical protein